MTVAELFEKCEVKSTLKVMSAFNGKVLCHNFNPEKHEEIGNRRVECVFADIVVRESGFGHYASPVMCVYPLYPPVIPNAFFAYPWYGYAGNSMCYGSGLQQATQQANIQQLNSRILELQMQQCCCNQITALNNRLSDMVNAAQFQRVLEPKRPKDFVYELDKILFPDNPIRDYIQEEIRKIKEKYAERIKKLDALLA